MAEQYFLYHLLGDDQRLQVASFHMDGAALHWYQYTHRNNRFIVWVDLVRALVIRFGPSNYEDHQGALAKLTQRSSVAIYQTQFETLANRTTNSSQSFLTSCFVSGLQPNIRSEVLAFRPTVMAKAIGLARLQEAKLTETPHFPPRAPFTRYIPPLPNVLALPAPPTVLALPTPPLATRLPIKRLSPAELQTRREKGLCYNCDERYTPVHRCKNRRLLLLTNDEDEDNDENIELLDDTGEYGETSTPHPEISIHALSGTTSPCTLRVTGSIGGTKLQILIDSGSTNNFIQEWIAVHLKLLVTPAHFPVMVGNGETLRCMGACNGVALSIQD